MNGEPHSSHRAERCMPCAHIHTIYQYCMRARSRNIISDGAGILRRRADMQNSIDLIELKDSRHKRKGEACVCHISCCGCHVPSVVLAR